MFLHLDTVPNLPDQEKETIKFWEKLNIVELLKTTRKDAPEKVYFDGPITANNMPHYGHAITWTMKDLVPRYWSMKGYYVSRNMGWDCQGIPVEYEVEKSLGFDKKEDIEAFGVAKFNELCRQSVLKYRDAIFNYETRLGRWFDEKDMYYTMDASFIESMWWALKTLYEKGFLYEGYKVVAYSTRAGTSLSTHEVRDGGYMDMEDPAITVKFKSVEDPNTFYLAWTTTPWTIPANLMLAVNSSVEYAKVEYAGSFYILASELVGKVFEGKEYLVVETLQPTDLIGKEYIPPYDYYLNKKADGCFKIIESYHVTIEDGTGIVHLAPYGAEDFDKFMELGITNLFDYLDETAKFTPEIPEYQGMFYRDANPVIVEALQSKGVLFKYETIMHSMPKCWRTGTPLIYKPLKSWYISVTKLKDKMLSENQNVNWQPEHIKDGMSKLWIENARDWALSRSRYWGTPLPIWINDKTGELKVIGSFAELQELSGVLLTDPHKPFVDEVVWEDKVNGGVFKRIPDVVDVWFDSGAVPFAKLHYPFENAEKFDKTVPAEYISEGLDQVRLWFYTMHVLGVGLFDQVPYKNAVVTGMLLDKNGKKLSKSKKNYPPMEEVLDAYGADVLRYFILTSPLSVGEFARFYNEALDDIRKEFFLPLWNSVKYFTTYANMYDFKPSLEFPKTTNNLDTWILTRLKEVGIEVDLKLSEYKFMEAARNLTPFVSDLSTWYIRRSRDRIKDGDLEALNTLYYVLAEFSRIIAPFLPFMSEKMYAVLDMTALTGLQSVHLDMFPSFSALSTEEKDLLKKMDVTRKIVSVALGVRASTGLKVRQPLNTLYLEVAELSLFEDLVESEVNVKKISVGTEIESESEKIVSIDDMSLGFKVYLDTEITEDLLVEGNARELIRKIQDLRKVAGLNVADKINTVYETTDLNKKSVDQFSDLIKSTTNTQNLEAGDSFLVEKI